MANATRVAVGDWLHVYVAARNTWSAKRVTVVTSQTNVTFGAFGAFNKWNRAKPIPNGGWRRYS